VARLCAFACVLLLTGCGGESGGGGPGAAGGLGAADAAYQEAYAAAWVKACKQAVADLRKQVGNRAARVKCDQPVEHMEGNTSFDPAEASAEGRRQGAFDGCAYAWDDAYAAGGEVEVDPRC
jgi:hypothetical protein